MAAVHYHMYTICMSDVLEFDGIELSYGTRRILFGTYMKCCVGEIVGVLGRNGSGKSSLFKVVFGSQSADHRSVRLNGKPLSDDFLRQRLISYLPQRGLIPPHVTVEKALNLFGVARGEILEYFPDAEQQMTRRPNEMSGGYRRMIELMLVLKSPAKFCLLDEPFSGVMPVHIETLGRVLSAAAAYKGIILTDHLYRSVMSSAHRLYILSNGTTYAVRDRNDLVFRGYLTEQDDH
jgi:lipopolysaccharide export system ATP-binding protein